MCLIPVPVLFVNHATGASLSCAELVQQLLLQAWVSRAFFILRGIPTLVWSFSFNSLSCDDHSYELLASDVDSVYVPRQLRAACCLIFFCGGDAQSVLHSLDRDSFCSCWARLVLSLASFLFERCPLQPTYAT